MDLHILLVIILGASIVLADWFNVFPNSRRNRKYTIIGLICILVFILKDTLNILI
ncbi:hypothetical protein JCM14036_25660 [Desulfotomaculum defluvii]